MEATYNKYLRQMTQSKTEYAVVEEELQRDDFFALHEKLNALRNTNDRLWYWFKKEKEVYSKSIKAFSRMNRFFKRIEKFLIKEYGEESKELMHFKRSYYHHVLEPMDSEQVHSALNREIFEKKRISDIEMVYAMKEKDIKLPVTNKGVVNRLYSKMRPRDYENGQATSEWNGMFLNNEMKRDQDMVNGIGSPREEVVTAVVDDDSDISGDNTDDDEDKNGNEMDEEDEEEEEEGDSDGMNGHYVETPDGDELERSKGKNKKGIIEEPDDEVSDHHHGDSEYDDDGGL